MSHYTSILLYPVCAATDIYNEVNLDNE